MKTLYSESFGSETVYIQQYGDEHIVGHSTNGEIQRERFFRPTAYNSDTLSPAMACFDASCNYMATKTGIARPMPAAPNFAACIA